MPWYQIMRGLIILPFLVIAFGLVYAVVLLGWGRDEAGDIMRRMNE